MKKKARGIIIVSVLGAAAIFCSAMFTQQYLDAKNSKATFDDLTNLITEIDEPQKDTEAEEADLSAEELAAAEAALAREKYAALFVQNNDFIGWIRIDGTNVNYPVMQTPNKPDFYLKRSFDKSYSDYGVPYIDEACMTGISNNLVIYGHHMNDGSMFADLCKYTDADFCKEHPTIAFLKELPYLLVTMYAKQYGLATRIDDEKLIGARIDAVIPELRLAFAFSQKGTDREAKVAEVLHFLCKAKRIQLFVIRQKDPIALATEIKQAFAKANLFINSDSQRDVAHLRKRYFAQKNNGN